MQTIVPISVWFSKSSLYSSDQSCTWTEQLSSSFETWVALCIPVPFLKPLFSLGLFHACIGWGWAWDLTDSHKEFGDPFFHSIFWQDTTSRLFRSQGFLFQVPLANKKQIFFLRTLGICIASSNVTEAVQLLFWNLPQGKAKVEERGKERERERETGQRQRKREREEEKKDGRKKCGIFSYTLWLAGSPFPSPLAKKRWFLSRILLYELKMQFWNLVHPWVKAKW